MSWFFSVVYLTLAQMLGAGIGGMAMSFTVKKFLEIETLDLVAIGSMIGVGVTHFIGRRILDQTC